MTSERQERRKSPAPTRAASREKKRQTEVVRKGPVSFFLGTSLMGLVEKTEGGESLVPVVFVMLDGYGFDFFDDDTYCIISYYGQDMSRFLTGFWLTVVLWTFFHPKCSQCDESFCS